MVLGALGLLYGLSWAQQKVVDVTADPFAEDVAQTAAGEDQC